MLLFAGVACLVLGAALPAAAQTYTATDQASFDTALGNANGGGNIQINGSFNASSPVNGTNVFMPVNLQTFALGVTGLGGTGGLDVSSGGSGVLSLTGTNSFAGNLRGTSITISADSNAALGGGTLILNGATFKAAADFNNSHAVSLTGAGATIDSNGHALTLSGTVSGGAGSVFFVTGGGTVTVTGTNTFTGQVTAANGTTLSISNASALGAGATAITLQNLGKLQTTADMTLSRGIALASGGTLDVASGTTLTMNGTISGTGTLSKTSAGTLVLNSANTFSSSQISAGAVVLGNAGALGSGPVTLGNATLRAGADMTVANAVASSSGGTVDNGGHSLTLSGATNSFINTIFAGAGATMVNGGAFTGATINPGVAVQLGGSSTAVSGAITNNGLLTLNWSSIRAVGASISGTGGLTMNGSSIVLLTGTNTYSGVTTINSGELQVGGGAGAPGLTGSLGTGAVINNGALVFARTNTMTVANAISGSGTVTQGGSGVVILTGDNSYSGTTTISNGSLVVGAGGTTGSLGTGAVVNNGLLAFNRSDAVTVANTISGTGSLYQNGASKLILNGVNTYTGGTTVNSGELQVGDASNPTASIAGAVTVTAGATLSGHGSIGGDVTNNGVVAPGGSIGTLTVAGNYTSNSASQLLIQVTPTAASLLKVGGTATLGGTLTLAYAPGVYTASRFPLVQAGSLSGTFATVNETGSIPTTLTRTVGYSSTRATLTLAGATVVTPADDALFGSTQTVLATGGHSALGLLLDRKADPADEACLTPGAAAPQGAEALCRKGGWVRAFGQFSSVNGQGTNPGFTSRGGGFLAGVARSLDGGTLGLAGGYQRSDLSDSGGGRAQADTVRLDGYAARAYGPAVLSAVVGYAWNHVGSQRDAGPFKAAATYDVHEIDGGLQAAAPVRLGGATLTPKAGLRYVELLQDGFTEKAPGAFGVTGHAQNLDSLQPFLGAELSRASDWQGGTLSPELRLGVRHELLDVARRTDVRSATGYDFVAASTTPGRDVVSAGAGMTFVRGDRAAISARYDADFAREVVSQTVSIGAHLRF